MLHKRRLVWERGVLTTMILFTAALLAHATPALATHAPGTSCTPGRDVAYEDWTWLGRPGFQYRIVVASFPDELVRSGQTRDRTIARIRDGVRAWNQGRNDCHLRRFGGFNTNFLSVCDVPPCPSGGDHFDDRSTIDFASPANIECQAVPGAVIVGCTSIRRIGEEVQTKVGWKNQLQEADIR